MYGTLSEILLERGLWQIGMQDLLALPTSEDYAVQRYLHQMMEAAIAADDAREDSDEASATDGAPSAAESVCAEIERLWDEGVSLMVEDTIIMDLGNFWRMMVMLPMLFFASEDSEYAVDDDSIVEVLEFGFSSSRDVPVRFSDFEAVLAAVPDDLAYSFLMGLEDEAKLQCLMRLALSEEGWLFSMNEPLLRVVILDSSDTVRNAMLQLFDGLNVAFTLNVLAPCDSTWVDNCGCEVCYNPFPCPYAQM